MLLDSGANVSLISLDARRKIPNQSESANHVIQVASGTNMHCTESVSVDIPFGDGVLYNVRFIVCPTLPYDCILGINHIGKKFSVDFEEGTATIDNLQTNLLMPGQQIGCSTLEEITIPSQTCCSITIQSPTVEKDLAHEKVVILETPTTGFLPDNDIAILEGLYTNDKYIQTWVTNPHPFPLTIPAGTPIATGTTLENINDRYECNELIEVKKGDKHEQDFLEHLEFRRRKFQPETSDAYKNVQLGTSISEKQKAELEQILADNRPAFSVSDSDIGFIKDYMFGITWKDEDAEVYHKPRPCTPSMREKAKSKIDLWRETNVIEPSSSRNNIPLFFIKKGTKGDVRPILDCRAVNEQTIANRFPIPHLKDLLSEISELIGTHGKQELYISTTDIQSAFNQLVVRPEDRHKCAFSFQNRQYQAARCLFGLRNAPSAFCEVMARVLDGLPNCFVLDMVNAHPHIQHRRHPDLAALREYVRQREAALRSIPGERDDAKQLFIRLVYKGLWRKWCQDAGVNPGALLDIVERFRVEQEEISRRDQEANQEILRVLQAEDPGRAAQRGGAAHQGFRRRRPGRHPGAEPEVASVRESSAVADAPHRVPAGQAKKDGGNASRSSRV